MPSPAVTSRIRFELRDRAGDVPAVHVRIETADGGKRFVWEQADGSPGLRARPVANLPLYGIWRIGEASPDQPVYVTEGEKAADVLTAVGLLGVGTVTGASGTPDDEVLSSLAGRDVRLWPDNDAVGWAHMERIAKRLVELGVAVSLVDWPDAPEHGDAADFLAAGRLRADVDALVARARSFPPPHTSRPIPDDVPVPPHVGRRAKVVRLADVEPERVEWLWPGRIPLGKLTVLDGDPGVGKSTISLDLAARVTTGRPMPGETIGSAPAGVVILSAEDGLADTIRPRLDAAGADSSRVVALTAIVGADGTERLSSLPLDLVQLEEAVRASGAILVVVDVLMAFLDGGLNAHRDQDVRGALAQLAATAERTGAAFLVLRHLNKTAGGPVLYRGGGSIGIVGAARSALVVGRDPADEGRLVLAIMKANLARTAPSVAYRILDADGVGRISWEGETSWTAAQLVAIPATADERTARDDAKAILSEILSAGSLPAREAQRQAREAGVSGGTLRRAKEALGVAAKRAGGLGAAGWWEWSLDPKAPSKLLIRSIPEVERVRRRMSAIAPFEPDSIEIARTGAEPSESAVNVGCSDYRRHQLAHRCVEDRWLCDRCDANTSFETRAHPGRAEVGFFGDEYVVGTA